MPKDDKKQLNTRTTKQDDQAQQQELDKLHQVATAFTTWGRDPERRDELEALADDASTRGLLNAMDYFGSQDPGESQRPGLKEGNIVEGTVTEIQDCSIFLDLGGGATGLVHCSDLSWVRFDHPTDIVKLGQRLQVKILHNPPTSRVIHLGLKHVTPDPWDTAEQDFPPDSQVEALVTHKNKNGVWFEVAPGIEGFAGACWLRDTDQRLNWRDVFQLGQRVTMKVASVDAGARHMSLAWKPKVWEAGQDDDGEGCE